MKLQERPSDCPLLLFVCALNTCRSVVGHAIFNYIKDQTNLELRVASAGLWACEGQACNSEIESVASKRGYDLSAYRSTPLQTLQPADYSRVFIFEQAHFAPCKDWMGNSNAPEYIMAYSKYFGNQEVLMHGVGNAADVYTRLFDFIEDGCLGLYNQLSERKNDGF